MNTSVLSQKVNFIVSMFFIGSAALLAIIVILEAADENNPIAEMMAKTVYAGELTDR